MPVKYTDEECNFIRKNGSQLTTNELWLAIERTFHTGHTKQSVRTKAKQLGVIKTKDARSRALMNIPGKYRIGDKAVMNGYEYTKVFEHGTFYKAWKRSQVIVWEEKYGPVPEGHKVIFLNGDHLDCCLENLACVSNAILGKMKNGKGKPLYSESGNITKTALKVCELDLKLREVEKANDTDRK